MIYLEMSRDEQHGGGTWAFGNCVWAPVANRSGRSWAFWEKVGRVQQGDTILHLRGKSPDAFFVGYSTAMTDGFKTSQKPPEPGEWGYSDAFYRADLDGYIPFHHPISLLEIFERRGQILEKYLEDHKNRAKRKSNLFYVKQAGKLQCLQGAYLSDVDEPLLIALFGERSDTEQWSHNEGVVSVETGIQLRTVRSRLGQSIFSEQIKKLYGYQCAFPGCDIKDPRFLVASHIARWCDNEKLRGELGNGLCLCILHDRAFELGLFTIDEHFAVFVNPKEHRFKSIVTRDLLKHQGEAVRLTAVPPLSEALLEHWIRVDIDTMTPILEEQLMP
jgi:hypothetical protein